MGFKLVNTQTGEEVMTGEALINNKVERQDSKRYRVEIKLEDGTIINRYTDYFNVDDASKDITIEGMTFKEVSLANIADTYIEKL